VLQGVAVCCSVLQGVADIIKGSASLLAGQACVVLCCVVLCCVVLCCVRLYMFIRDLAYSYVT